MTNRLSRYQRRHSERRRLYVSNKYVRRHVGRDDHDARGEWRCDQCLLRATFGAGPFPGMVLIHHMPGWDEWYREATRKFAHHGYATISPNLYYRVGHGTPEDVAAKARAAGGVPDDQAVGDAEGAMKYLRSLPTLNGKVGIFGTCSGGRHATLSASRVKGFDALVDCWAGGVVMAKEDLTANRPVAPIEYTKDLSCPILGLFGEEDKSPTPEQVALHEAELKNITRFTSSLCIPKRDTASSIMIARRIGKSRRWMVGRKRLRSWKSIWLRISNFKDQTSNFKFGV